MLISGKRARNTKRAELQSMNISMSITTENTMNEWQAGVKLENYYFLSLAWFTLVQKRTYKLLNILFAENGFSSVQLLNT